MNLWGGYFGVAKGQLKAVAEEEEKKILKSGGWAQGQSWRQTRRTRRAQSKEAEQKALPVGLTSGEEPPLLKVAEEEPGRPSKGALKPVIPLSGSVASMATADIFSGRTVSGLLRDDELLQEEASAQAQGVLTSVTARKKKSGRTSSRTLPTRGSSAAAWEAVSLEPPIASRTRSKSRSVSAVLRKPRAGPKRLRRDRV